jgi:hypothetical protein
MEQFPVTEASMVVIAASKVALGILFSSSEQREQIIGMMASCCESGEELFQFRCGIGLVGAEAAHTEYLPKNETSEDAFGM